MRLFYSFELVKTVFSKAETATDARSYSNSQWHDTQNESSNEVLIVRQGVPFFLGNCASKSKTNRTPEAWSGLGIGWNVWDFALVLFMATRRKSRISANDYYSSSVRTGRHRVFCTARGWKRQVPKICLWEFANGA